MTEVFVGILTLVMLLVLYYFATSFFEIMERELKKRPSYNAVSTGEKRFGNWARSETLAGIVFISIWLGVMLLWSGSNETDVTDYTNPATDEPCRINGHPLWTDC